jgi:hypothetical protein
MIYDKKVSVHTALLEMKTHPEYVAKYPEQVNYSDWHTSNGNEVPKLLTFCLYKLFTLIFGSQTGRIFYLSQRKKPLVLILRSELVGSQ